MKGEGGRGLGVGNSRWWWGSKGWVEWVIKECIEPMLSQLSHAANVQIMYSQFIRCSKLAAMQGIWPCNKLATIQLIVHGANWLKCKKVIMQPIGHVVICNWPHSLLGHTAIWPMQSISQQHQLGHSIKWLKCKKVTMHQIGYIVIFEFQHWCEGPKTCQLQS